MRTRCSPPPSPMLRSGWREENGFEVVYKQSFPQGIDFASLMQAVIETDPDIVLSGGYTLGMIELVNRAAEQGVSFPMWMFSLGPTVPGFLDGRGRERREPPEPIQWAPNSPPDQEDKIFGWTAARVRGAVRGRRWATCRTTTRRSRRPRSRCSTRLINEAGTLDRDGGAGGDRRRRAHEAFYGDVCFDERGVGGTASRWGVAQDPGREARRRLAGRVRRGGARLPKSRLLATTSIIGLRSSR